MGARRALSGIAVSGETTASNARAHDRIFAVLAAALAALAIACSGALSTDGPAMAKPGKITSDLLALYDSYRDAQQRGVEFRLEQSRLRVVEDRVLIDATAAVDGRQLEADLVSLGMRQASTFGRVVSGQLPITSIPRLQALGSLAVARASLAAPRPLAPTMPIRP